MKNAPDSAISGLRIGHLVERQAIEVIAARALAGPELIDRIGERNRARFLPVIERVLDEFDQPGRVIRLADLRLDLGGFANGDLAGAEERLEAALRAALRRAVAAGDIVRPLGLALVEMMEHYLLHGAWPYGTGLDRAAAPAALLAGLIADEPAALVAMLRRRGPADPLLRRLVLQMPGALLEALLHRLEPRHAAYVILYLGEVRASHRAVPVLPVTPAAFDIILWTIVLRDALRRTGLEANRKAFLRRLLGELAVAGGASAGELALQLRRGLRRLHREQKKAGSLLRLLEELVAEKSFAPTLSLRMAELAELLDREGGEPENLARALEGARAADAAGLRALLRSRAAADAGRLRRRLEAALPPSAWPALLFPPHLAELLPPDGAATAETREALLSAAAQTPESALPAALARRLHLPQDGAATAEDSDADALLAAAALRPPHLAEPLPPDGVVTAVAPDALLAAAAVTPDALLAAAARTPESALPAALAKRLRLRRARRGPARLARGYAALELVAALAGVPAFARARALGRLLPRLGAVPAARLREVLAEIGIAELSVPEWRRLALLLGATARQLRGADPEAVARALLAGGGVPEAPPPLTHEQRTALAETLRRLDDAVLDRLIAALRPGGWPGSPRWQVAFDLLVASEPPVAIPATAAGGGVALALLRARLGAAARRPARLERALAGLAPHRLRPLLAALAPRARATPGQEARMLAALIAGAEPPVALPEAAPRREQRLAALLRARPLAALQLAAAEPPALPALLEAPEGPVLLFAALPPAERARAIRIGRLLTGRAGRAAIPSSKVARALALAAGAWDWRSNAAGFVAAWLEALGALATPGEKAALKRLLGRDLPAGRRRSPPPPPPRPAPPKAAQLRAALRDGHRRAALLRGLGEGGLTALLVRIAPRSAAALLHAAERIAAARRSAGVGFDRALFWRILLAAAARDPDDLAPLLAAMLDGGGEAPAVPAARRAEVERRLRDSLEGGRDAALRAALDVRDRERPKPVPAPVTPPVDVEPGAIHVGNAGLVIASAFLPRLFDRLGFLAPDPSGRATWVDREAQARAVHLLQWLVDGRCAAPEPQLALNKTLCGMDPADPVPAAIEPSEAELADLETLLATILAGWPPLNASSAEALREGFLQREGRLIREEQGWHLEVERKVIDILLDQLPWGFSTIRHSWMEKLLTVTWR